MWLGALHGRPPSNGGDVKPWVKEKVVRFKPDWTGIWNRMMEWKMDWNSECTQLQVTRVTGAAQSRPNYLVYLQACYLTAEAL